MNETVDVPRLPILVRPMAPEETALVLGRWKQTLFNERHKRAWGRGLRDQEFWLLANYVLDRITLPTSEVWMAAHQDTPTMPLAWVVARDGLLLFKYARARLMADRELCDRIEEHLLRTIPSIAVHVQAFNPFLELSRK